MTVTIYRSTDSGAPTIGSTAGQLVTALDAILVGSGGIAYGSKPSQGWTAPYSDTNKRVYRGPAGGTQMYLRIDDTGTTQARARGWEVKADINDVVDASNTGPFPTNAQCSGGVYLAKSSTGTRAWVAFGNGKILYFFIQYGGSVTNNWGWAIGDITTYKTSDAYNFIISASNTASYPYFGYKTANANYMPRVAAQTGASVSCTTFGSLYGNAGYIGCTGFSFYPHLADNYIWMSPYYVYDTTIVRGLFPGIWDQHHTRSYFNNGDTFTGVGRFAGKTFEIVRGQCSSGTDYLATVIETSDTW